MDNDRDKLAPVVLFTYNRLNHTKQTVEALKRNILADNTELYIYSDASKSRNTIDSVTAVREYLHGISGFKHVEIIERGENWGLARNIIDGVTNIVNEYGKIIVLEDDIVTSRYFLKYMNDALNLYKNEPSVMAISSNFLGKDKKGLPETFFLEWFNCWGWATWENAWRKFERNPEKLSKFYNLKNDKHFNMNGTENMWSQIEKNISGELYTWAIFFYTTIYINKGLVLFCNEDLSINIGMDASGEHCGIDVLGLYSSVLKNTPVNYFSRDYFTNIKGEQSIENVNRIRLDYNSLEKRIIRVFKNEGMKGIYCRVKNRIRNNINK